VGASSWRLGWLITAESLYRAGIGYILGVSVAYLTAAFIMARWPQFNVLIEPRIVLQVGGLTVLMSLFAALLPLRRLNQIDPITVFKA
ncbi:MAG: hypothetical protein L3J16_07585, partial [Anaerolineales bacterium]|nr:hypothetical protein [Anaerolineales bacterium]